MPARAPDDHQIRRRQTGDDVQTQGLLSSARITTFPRLTLEQGGDGSYRLIEVPDSDAAGMLREILSSLPTVDASFGDDAQQRKMLSKNIREACLAMTACRAAIIRFDEDKPATMFKRKGF